MRVRECTNLNSSQWLDGFKEDGCLDLGSRNIHTPRITITYDKLIG